MLVCIRKAGILMNIITWGMIGCGDVTEVKNGPGLYLANQSRLKGITNRTHEKAQNWVKRHGHGIVYPSIEELLADEEIDIVYIAVTPDKHMEYAIMCAKAGKHCLIEKPLAMNYEEGLAIQEAFEQAGKKAFVAFYRRGMNRFVKIKELLSDNTIGEVLGANVTRYVAPMKDKTQWRANPAISGGNEFTETDIHILDYLVFLFGNIKEHSIMKTQHPDSGEISSVCCNLKFASGILVSGNWNYQCEYTKDCIEIVGTKGFLIFDFFHNEKPIVVSTANGTTDYVVEDSRSVGLNLEQQIVNELLGLEKCSATVHEALKTLRISGEIK
jgi:predicted dehydrogenase